MNKLKVVFVNRCKLNQKMMAMQGYPELKTRLSILHMTLKKSLSDMQRQLASHGGGAHIIKMKKAGFQPQLLLPQAGI